MQAQPRRRVFMFQVVAGAAGLALPAAARADNSVPVKETDPYPKSMGFRLDTNTVDQAKFPRHAPTQKCSECQLFSGKASDELGTCSFFKRQVPPTGWCRNFKQRKPGA